MCYALILYIKVARLMYKAVWPTTARDFVVLSYCTRIDATTRIHGAFSVSWSNSLAYIVHASYITIDYSS